MIDPEELRRQIEAEAERLRQERRGTLSTDDPEALRQGIEQEAQRLRGERQGQIAVAPEAGGESRFKSLLRGARRLAAGQGPLSRVVNPRRYSALNLPQGPLSRAVNPPATKYVVDPLSALSEAGAQITASGPLARRVPDRFRLLGTQPITLEEGTAFGELTRGRPLTDVGALLLEELAAKNAAQQLGTQALFDPLNVVPGVGFAKLPRLGAQTARVSTAAAAGARIPPPIAGVSRQPGAVRPVRPTGPLRAEPGPTRPDSLEFPAEFLSNLDEGTPPNVGVRGIRQTAGPPISAGVSDLPESVVPLERGVTEALPAPDKDPLIQKARRILRRAERVSGGEKRTLDAAERRRRFAAGMGSAEGVPLRERSRRFFGAHAGEFPTLDVRFRGDEVFTAAEHDELLKRIYAPGVLREGYHQENTAAAYSKLFMEDVAILPTPGELQLLERVFGAKFVREIIKKKRNATQAVWDEFLSLWNLPRAVVASFDLSATGRQGGMLGPGNAREWASSFRAQLDAFKSEKYASKVWDEIYFDPDFERFADIGNLSLTRRGTAAQFADREEVYMTKHIGKLLAPSERAYVTGLNKLRWDVMKKMVSTIERGGIKATDEELRAAGSFINIATGRGNLGALQPLAPILNGVMFSPRFAASRFQALSLPIAAYRNPAIRKQVAKDLVAFLSFGALTNWLLHEAGADVALDPRSGQWGKAQVGNTRIDVWAGMQPTMRLIARLYMAQGKTSLGKVYSTDDEGLIAKHRRIKDQNIRGEGGRKLTDEEFALEGRFLPARAAVLKKFMRSKLAPVPGELLTQITGFDWLGEPTEASQFKLPPTSLANIRRNPLIENMTPILVQDILDAIEIEDNPWLIGGIAALSTVGVGTGTYETSADIAEETFPEGYTPTQEDRKRIREELQRRRTGERPGAGALVR